MLDKPTVGLYYRLNNESHRGYLTRDVIDKNRVIRKPYNLFMRLSGLSDLSISGSV